MDKENVMKALELCGTGSKTCTGCPYHGMNDCDRHMCDDAMTLLKANEQPKAIEYHTAIIYTKRDNLLNWYHGKADFAPGSLGYYAEEREVQLILLVRHEEGKCICRIKCPVNPLPIKGEFEAVNSAEVGRLLRKLGWTFKERFNLSVFK